MSLSSNYRITYFGFLAVTVFGILAARRFYNFKKLINQPALLLELRPPASNKQSLLATEQLFKVLHDYADSLSLKQRILGKSNSVSFEVVSTRKSGIRFMLRVSHGDASVIKQYLSSYLPGVRIKVIKDYASRQLMTINPTYLMEFKQAGHFAYPLSSPDSLNRYDPIAYLTGSMTKLAVDELMAYQLVLSPSFSIRARYIRKRLLVGKHLSLSKSKITRLSGLLRSGLALTASVLQLILSIFGSPSNQFRNSQERDRLRNMPSNEAKFVASLVQDKLAQPLFRVSIRALVITPDATVAKTSTAALASALAGYNRSGYQGMVIKGRLATRFIGQYRAFSFRYRLPTILTSNANILSVSEVASLYHFPDSETAQPENLAISHSRSIAAPALIKKHADDGKLDVVLGQNVHNGSISEIGLTQEERERHILILGGTGSGKTTMMQYAALQDIRCGKGMAIVDPHGDFAKTILEHIPEERLNDVIYLNPIDIKYPVGLNLLELPSGLSHDQLLIEKDRICEAAISVLRKVFSDDEANAHRIESLFRNAIRTALEVEGATLFTVLKLLRNRVYRWSVVNDLKDEDLKDFWREEFGKAGEMQRVSMSKGLTARIDRFNSSEPAKRMLGQAKSTIDFENIINSGKILICNLSEGELIEDTSALLGTIILAKLKLAAERRTSITQTERKPFYLYVDEFQNFATTPFVKMLSSSRKYKLFLTIAQQSMAQQEEQRLTETILANVRTVVCFSSGSPADERLILPQFSPHVQKDEISNLPAYNFYISIKAVTPMEPMSGETLLIDNASSSIMADRVIGLSRINYASEYTQMPKPETDPPLRGKGYVEVRQRPSW